MAALRLLLGTQPALPATLWLLEGPLSPDCQREYSRLLGAYPQVEVTRIPTGIPAPEAFPPLSLPKDTACLVDALFGTGLCREVSGGAARLCHLMNKAQAQGIPVISVDIPSGLHGETGQVMGIAVHATETLTFHRSKPGLWLGLGPNYTGKVTTADIGLLPEWDDAQGFLLLEPSDLARLLPRRQPVTHKGSYGRVLIIAGRRGMAGAAALCALSCLRTGAGLVTIACPEGIVDILQQLCPCATCLPLPKDAPKALETLLPALSKADAIAMGCGLGTDEYAQALVLGVTQFLTQANTPAVLDADGLNVLAMAKDFSPRFTSRQILTPHPAEAARLLGLSTEEITEDAPKAARMLADHFSASIVLKGTASVLLSGAQEGLNVLGTPALAKGGSGDVLTGALAALAAFQTLSDFEILQAGCALHGLAGKAAADALGERGVLATDVCDFLGRDD